MFFWMDSNQGSSEAKSRGGWMADSRMHWLPLCNYCRLKVKHMEIICSVVIKETHTRTVRQVYMCTLSEGAHTYRAFTEWMCTFCSIERALINPGGACAECQGKLLWIHLPLLVLLSMRRAPVDGMEWGWGRISQRAYLSLANGTFVTSPRKPIKGSRTRGSFWTRGRRAAGISLERRRLRWRRPWRVEGVTEPTLFSLRPPTPTPCN